MEFIIKVANNCFKIISLYDFIYTFCKDYIVDNCEVDYTFTTTIEDLEYERKTAIEEFQLNHQDYPGYSNTYLEMLSIHRKVTSVLLDQDIILMHGSVVAIDNEAYLFTAKSGTGKTTHTNLWLENIPGSYIVNGDKPLLMMKDNQVYVCGTPWCGKERMNRNVIVPLKAICKLERGIENDIKEVSFDEILPTLLQQVNRPSDMTRLKKTLNVMNRLRGKLTFYELKCNMDVEACRISYNKMKKGD